MDCIARGNFNYNRPHASQPPFPHTISVYPQGVNLRQSVSKIFSNKYIYFQRNLRNLWIYFFFVPC